MSFALTNYIIRKRGFDSYRNPQLKENCVRVKLSKMGTPCSQGHSFAFYIYMKWRGQEWKTIPLLTVSDNYRENLSCHAFNLIPLMPDCFPG